MSRTEDAVAGPGTPPEATAGPAGPLRPPVREAVRYSLQVFLALRLGLLVLGLAATALLPPFAVAGPDSGVPRPVGVPGWPAPSLTPGWHNAVTAWERFDALWFLRIAEGGYADGDGSAAFFPLYPMAVRAVSVALGGHPLAAALVVSNAAFLGALVVLYLLTARDLSEPAARKAVLYTAVFPTSFFFLAPYSESLFLLLAVVAFRAARRGRWPVAGLAGALAGLTRSVGVLLVPALAVEALHQWRERRVRPLLPLLWSGVAGLGTVGYLAYWRATAGEWLAPFTQQARWQRGSSLPWDTLADGTREAFRWLGVYPGGYHLLDWLVVVPALAAAAYAAARFRPSYAVYLCSGILVPLSFIFAGRPLMSIPRFLVVLFPLFWVPAQLSERGRLPHHLVVGISAAGLGIFSVLFVNWYFIF